MKLLGLELPPILTEALTECRQHFYAAAGFSLLINILYLAPTPRDDDPATAAGL